MGQLIACRSRCDQQLVARTRGPKASDAKPADAWQHVKTQIDAFVGDCCKSINPRAVVAASDKFGEPSDSRARTALSRPPEKVQRVLRVEADRDSGLGGAIGDLDK